MATEGDGAEGGGAHRISPLIRALLRKDSVAGLMFIAIAAAGLWIARAYPVGTLRRMGSGYMPQLLCWVLMALGLVVLFQGLLARGKPSLLEEAEEVRAQAEQDARSSLLSVFLVAASLVAFALSLQQFGLVVAISLLVLIASFAYRGLGWIETIVTAAILTALSWAVFVEGLGMAVKLLPEI